MFPRIHRAGFLLALMLVVLLVSGAGAADRNAVASSTQGTDVLAASPAVPKGLPFPLEPGDVFANAPVGVIKSAPPPVRPFFSSALGVIKTPGASAPGSVRIYSSAVGIYRGAGIQRIEPGAVDIGLAGQMLLVHGLHLDQMSSIAVVPPTGVTIVSSNVLAGGQSLEVVLDVAANAIPGLRRLSLRDATGKEIPDLHPQASALLVREQGPVIESITPSLVRTGQTVAMQIRGRNLRGLPVQRVFDPQPRIVVTPATGIVIGTDVLANDEGTLVTLTLSVASDAPLTERVVQVITESGTSTNMALATNTLRVSNAALRTLGPIASPPLRVLRESASSNIARSLYSTPVTVARGPAILAMTPAFALPGETIELRLSGRELAATSAVEFSAATGLTVVANSLFASAEEIRLSVQVAADAPRTLRRVTALVGSRRIDAPILLDVRDAPPQITALRPKYLIRNGSSQVIEIQGLQLARTNAASIVPNAGIVVESYQALSDTTARLTLRAAVDTALGTRLVRVTTPSLISSDVPDPFNTLSIVDNAQILTPFVSPLLGVIKSAPSQPAPTRSFVSPALGVVRGPYALSVTPPTLPRGSTTTISVGGTGLDAVTALEIFAGDGISVSGLQVSGGGTQLSAQVTVAADAQSSARVVRLRRATGEVPFVPASEAIIGISNNQPNAPTAVADTYVATANSILQVGIAEGVLVNDTDPENGVLYAVLRRLPASGVLNLSSDGSFVYVPNADFAGTDRFEYSAGRGPVVGTATTVTINVREPNDAVNDSYQARDNEVLTVPANLGLLANDVRTTANPSIELDSQPTRGSIVVAPNGGFVYTPDGSSGIDRFRYRLIDGALRSLPAEVTIDVAAVNEAPIAENDFYAVDRNRTLNVAAPGVRGNDRDPDNDPLTLRVVIDPPIGTLSVSNNGAFSYVPPNNFVGQTLFTYELVDPQGLRDEAVVTITVNDSLAPQPDSYTMNEGEVLFVDAPGLLANDSILPRGTLRVLITQQPNFGTVQAANDGSFVYRPGDPERSGVATFKYALQDDVVTSAPVDVRVTINGVNDPPAVQADRYLSDENAELIVAAPGVLDNDEDIDSASFTAVLHTPPPRGVVTLRADGSFNYVPEVNFRGIETFQYRATDAQGASSIGTVTIEVTQPPTATNDVYLVDIDTTLTVDDPLQGMLINDHDAPERDPLTVIPGQPPAHGTLTLNANGTFVYTPATGFSGIDTFTYQVTDGRSRSNVGNVTLAVGITSLPRAYPDEYELTEDQDFVVPAIDGVLINDTDADTPANLLEAYLVGVDSPNFQPLNVTLNRDGSFRVRPPANFYGETFFAYQVYDGTDISNTAIVTLTVLPVNDGVDAKDDRYPVKRNTVFETIQHPTVKHNDRFDLDFEVRLEIVTPPQFGTAELNPVTGFLRYTPQNNFSGTDTFTYRLYQPLTNVSDTATVTLRTNAAPTAAPDAYTVPEDADTVVTPAPIANDTDADGDPLTFTFQNYSDGRYIILNLSSLSAPTVATAQTRQHFYGLRTVRYRTTDGTEEAEGTITFTVTPVPDDPVAHGESYLTNRDAPLVVSEPSRSILNNDFDPDAREYAGAPQWAAATGVDLLPLTLELVETTRNGALTLSPVGTFTYVPNVGYSGVDTFRYRLRDATGRNSAVATASIRVNSPAVGNDDAYSATEDVVLNVTAAQGLLSNDTDIDGDSLRASFASNGCNPCHGRVIVRDDGSFTYTPNRNYHGPDEFYYSVRDQFTSNDIARVAISVAPVNDAPVTEPDTYRTREDEVLVAPEPQGTLRNDREVDGDVLVDAAMVTPPAMGDVVFAEDGSFTYTPDPNVNGRDTFRYRVYDSTGLFTEDEVEVLLTSVNDAPTAAADAYETDQDRTLSVPAAQGVLANDRDVDGPGLAASLIGPPLHGQLTMQANGAFVYVPNGTHSGIDRFQYQVDDGLGALAVATAIITVRPIDVPVTVTVEDDFFAFEGPTLIVDAPGVLINDSTDAQAPLTAMVAIAPDVGTLSLQANGSFRFDAPAGFVGVTGFTYAASVAGVSELARVTLDVQRTDNVPPVAQGEQFAVFEDRLLDSRSSGGLLGNDSDFESAPLTAHLVEDVTHGVLTLSESGQFTYQPAADYHGSDRFRYRVYDGAAYSETVVAQITVYAQNDAPLAADDHYLADTDEQLNVTALLGLLANDSDVDGDTLQVELIDAPLHGQVQADANGAFRYRSTAGYSGIDRFRYSATDGTARAVATVLITVNAPGNSAPIAVGENYSIDEDTVLDGAVAGELIGNDSDPDGDPLTVRVTLAPTHGVVTIKAGHFTYRPERNYFGADAFTYVVSDGELESNAVVANIVIASINDVPLAVTDTYQVIQGQQLVVVDNNGVLANDSDVESGSMQASIELAPAHGSLQLAAGGGFTYIPQPAFFGRDEFSYRVSDGVAHSIGRVAIDVTRLANQRPIAVGEVYVLAEDTVFDSNAFESLLANDYDPDQQTLTLQVLSAPTLGTLEQLQGGHIRYTPARDQIGEAVVTYAVSDGELQSLPADLRLTLQPLPDDPIANPDSYHLPGSQNELQIDALQGVLVNDRDPDGDVLITTVVAAPAAGTLALGLDGSIRYVPGSPRADRDSFTYQVRDVSGRTAQATVQILMSDTPPLPDAIFKSSFEPTP